MTIRQALCIAIMSTLSISLCACSGEKSQTLNRATALKILNKSPDAMGRYGTVTFWFNTHLFARKEAGLEKAGEADKQFINDLVRAGFVTVKNSTEQPNGTNYVLSPIPQDGLFVTLPNSDVGNISFIVAKGTVKEITAIQQEGSEARVEVSFASSPTPMYQKLSDAVKSDLAVCGDPRLINWTFFCSRWPREGDITRTTKAEFKFVRYDDGWRLTSN